MKHLLVKLVAIRTSFSSDEELLSLKENSRNVQEASSLTDLSMIMDFYQAYQEIVFLES
jgi:hypothetical protein